MSLWIIRCMVLCIVSCNVRLCCVHQLCNWRGVGIAKDQYHHKYAYHLLIVQHNLFVSNKLNSFTLRDSNKVIHASINRIHRVTMAMATMSPTHT